MNTDPSGTKAKIYYDYDEKTNTTTIRIKASFAVYGANGQNVSQKDLTKFAGLLSSGIAKAYNNKAFEYGGRSFVLKTDISVKVAGTEDAAKTSGADNLVELGGQNSDILSSGSKEPGAAVFHRDGENFDRMIFDISPYGTPGGLGEGDNDFENTFGHEFGHLLGVIDRPERAGSLFNGDSPGPGLTQDDFVDLFDQESEMGYMPPVPPRNGGYRSLHILGIPSSLSRLTPNSSNILNSTNSGFEIRNTTGADNNYRWSSRVKN